MKKIVENILVNSVSTRARARCINDDYFNLSILITSMRMRERQLHMVKTPWSIFLVGKNVLRV